MLNNTEKSRQTAGEVRMMIADGSHQTGMTTGSKAQRNVAEVGSAGVADDATQKSTKQSVPNTRAS